jgi:hypothetical protein
MFLVVILVVLLLNIFSNFFFDSIQKDPKYNDLVPKWIVNLSIVPLIGLAISFLLISFGMLLILFETIDKQIKQ